MNIEKTGLGTCPISIHTNKIPTRVKRGLILSGLVEMSGSQARLTEGFNREIVFNMEGGCYRVAVEKPAG